MKFIDFLKGNKLIILLLIVVIVVGVFGGYFLLFRSGFFFLSRRNIPSFLSFEEKGRILEEPENLGVGREKSLLQSNTPSYSGGDLNEERFGLKIIKSGAVELVVEKGNFMEIWNKIIFTTKKFSGFVSNSNFYKQDERYFGNITVMIPSKDFDNFINEVSSFGEVENITVSSKDVTAEYVDLSSRLKVLEEQRDLILSWLSEAKEVKDMLSLRNELDKVITEIEKIKGRMNYISFHTDFSKITINLRERGEKSKVIPPIFRRIRDALNNALNGLITSIFVIIIVLAWLVPWITLIYIVYLIYKRRGIKKEASKNS